MPTHDPTQLPSDLPIPQDDGRMDHLGRSPFEHLPAGIALRCTDGSTIPLAELFARASSLVETTPGVEIRRIALFCYPRTGVPNQPPNLGLHGETWESIPGARGCTPQACGFRDLLDDFLSVGTLPIGLSTNTPDHQREFRERTKTGVHFLSDSELLLTRALALPTFEFPVESGGPSTLLARSAMILEPHDDAPPRITKVFYPVFPPDRCAATVLSWLRSTRASTSVIAHTPPTPPTPPTAERRRSGSAKLAVRPLAPADRSLMVELFTKHFGGPMISSRGMWIDTTTLPGLVAEYFVEGETPQRARIAALVVHTPPERGGDCELVALVSTMQGLGAGSLLLSSVAKLAKSAGARRVFLTASNDNVDALRFYQIRGWHLARVYPDALLEARKLKPHIPTHGPSGIPIRDDVELEIVFDRR